MMKSVEELEKVANAGDSTAQYELGVKYRKGDGVPVDKETAFKWILTAAENVAPQAMLLLPEIYGRGEGVKVDVFRAIAWAQHARSVIYHYVTSAKPDIDASNYLTHHLDLLYRYEEELLPQCPPDHGKLQAVHEEIWVLLRSKMNARWVEALELRDENSGCITSLVLGRTQEEIVTGEIKLQTGIFDRELNDDDYASVTSLDLSPATVRLKDFSSLARCPNLQELHLDEAYIKDISTLKNLKSLRVLDLRENDLTNVSDLRTLSNLEELNLDNNNVKTLSPLKDLKRLKSLRLWFNHKLTQKMVDELQSHLPECEIAFFETEPTHLRAIQRPRPWRKDFSPLPEE